MNKLSGRAWKFGDNISTDHIAPGRYFHLRSNLSELAKHVLEDARSNFASNVSPGDFIVAGNNFGLGSSREHAPIIIKMVGVSAVLAKSFARIFYRNAINIGLPAIICDTSQIEDGDQLIVNLEHGKIVNETRSREISFKPLPEIMRKILEEGGLVNFVKKYRDLEVLR
jgi:3-isopropylmalate/(R)-2-methylmalate dehydratase small subunit